MTQEEKASAYDVLLTKAKQIYNKENDVLIIHTIEDLFPEVRKNEDERIRKELIEFISYMHDADPRKKDWIEWLKKQGELKETLCEKCKKAQPSQSCQDITALGRCAVEHEQKVEPKFHKGDWIVFNGLTLYIKEV